MDIVALFEFHQTECNVTLNLSVRPLLDYYDGAYVSSKAWSLLDAKIIVLAVIVCWKVVLLIELVCLCSNAKSVNSSTGYELTCWCAKSRVRLVLFSRTQKVDDPCGQHIYIQEQCSTFDIDKDKLVMNGNI